MNGAALFWFFAAVTCAGAVAVVVSQNVVRMAVWLIVALGGAAGLFFQLSADFVGATQLLIYVGGTIVLLIFGVMLTASGPYLRIKTSPGEGFLAAGVGLLFVLVLMSTVLTIDWNAGRLKLAGLGKVGAEAYETALHKEGLSESDKTLLEQAYQPSAKADHAAEPAPKSGPAVAENPEAVDSHGSAPKPGDVHSVPAAPVYELKPGRRLTSAEAARLAALFGQEKAVVASAMPAQGDTIRPLGLALAGLRPDRDLNKVHAKAATTPGYLLPFEIVSVHLLVVLIGAAYLARTKRRRVEAS